MSDLVSVQVTTRMAWWVAPYLLAVRVILLTTLPFVDADGERLNAFLGRTGAFVADHGLRYYVNGKRVV